MPSVSIAGISTTSGGMVKNTAGRPSGPGRFAETTSASFASHQIPPPFRAFTERVGSFLVCQFALEYLWFSTVRKVSLHPDHLLTHLIFGAYHLRLVFYLTGGSLPAG